MNTFDRSEVDNLLFIRTTIRGPFERSEAIQSRMAACWRTGDHTHLTGQTLLLASNLLVCAKARATA